MPFMDMKQLSLFDYNALEPETREFVEQRTDEIRVLVKRSAQDIIEIGRMLTEVKGALEYGKFGDWLSAEFEWSQMTASRFMRVHARFKSNNLLDFNIAPSALCLLASPSTPDDAVDEALERADDDRWHLHYLEWCEDATEDEIDEMNEYLNRQEYSSRPTRGDFVKF